MNKHVPNDEVDVEKLANQCTVSIVVSDQVTGHGSYISVAVEDIPGVHFMLFYDVYMGIPDAVDDFRSVS